MPTSLRRLLAVVCQLLVLQLTGLGGGMACAVGWSTGGAPGATAQRAMPAAMQAAMQAAMHHGHGAVDGADADHRDHAAAATAADDADGRSDAHDGGAADAQQGAAHCALSAGCLPSLALGGPALRLAPASLVGEVRVQVGAALLPPSSEQGPEPPPPRG